MKIRKPYTPEILQNAFAIIFGRVMANDAVFFYQAITSYLLQFYSFFVSVDLYFFFVLCDCYYFHCIQRPLSKERCSPFPKLSSLPTFSIFFVKFDKNVCVGVFFCFCFVFVFKTHWLRQGRIQKVTHPGGGGGPVSESLILAPWSKSEKCRPHPPPPVILVP